MSDNNDLYPQIKEILSNLNKELHKVAEADSSVSENEVNFINQVEERIPKIEEELRHVFEDSNVTKEEKTTLYDHLGKLFDDSILYARIDDRIDEEEIFLITKLQVELSAIIKKLNQTS